jgi:hypothetical protein
MRSNEGLYELPLEVAAADSGLTADEVRNAFQELSEASLVEYDEEAEVVLDRRALRINHLRHPRNAQGERETNEKGNLKRDLRIPAAVKLFEQVPDSPLKATFLELCEVHSRDLFDEIQASDAPSVALYRAPSKPLSEAPSKPRVEQSRDEKSRDGAEPGSGGPRDDDALAKFKVETAALRELLHGRATPPPRLVPEEQS